MKPRLSANPISVGMVAVGFAAYVIVAAFTVYEGRSFGWAEFKALWPMHLVMAMLLLNVFVRPSRQRAPRIAPRDGEPFL